VNPQGSLQGKSGVVASGFARPAPDSQIVFRHVLRGMSYPGTVSTIPVSVDAPPDLPSAAAAACLTLLDYETRVWLQPVQGHVAIGEFLRFHCGCPLVASVAEADFAIALDGLNAPPLSVFAGGSPEAPHRSATLILNATSLSAGTPIKLHGPGIASARELRAQGLAHDFWTQWKTNHSRYPLGVDIILVSGNQLAALPRTTSAEL
jgi:alpha-D-ribose 1-methylphosphonate 5-triphosphate synthase subunit PhnH